MPGLTGFEATMLHGRLLRYLDEVARTGSIRRAAARLNVAASAINRQILSLEAELETPLFERMHGGLRLTATGEVLIAHVRETLREHKRTLGRMAALKGLMRGEVVIATMGGLAASVLTDAVRNFRDQHPRVKIVVRVLAREGIAQAVLVGDAHLGLGYNLPDNPRLFRALDFDHPIGVVVSPDHPLATRKSLRFAECVPYPLILGERGMALREAVELLIPANVEVSPAVETNSLEMMKNLAMTAPHATLLSLVEVQDDVRAGRLVFVPVDDRKARQSVALVHRAAGSLDAVVSTVVQYVSASFEAHR